MKTGFAAIAFRKLRYLEATFAFAMGFSLSESFAEAVDSYAGNDSMSGKENGDKIQNIIADITADKFSAGDSGADGDNEPERIAPSPEALAYLKVVEEGGKLDMKSTLGNMLWMARAR